MPETFGGNIVTHLSSGQPGRQTFAVAPYHYFLQRTQQREKLVFDALRSFTIFVFSKAPDALVRLSGDAEALEEGDAVQAENRTVELYVEGEVQLLVAGTVDGTASPIGVRITRHRDIYRVGKPWGHELWINGQHPAYALKRIVVTAGNKTSLQYHRLKSETNLLVSGTARLHYKSSADVRNEDVTASDIAFVEVNPLTSIAVVPPVLHRIEAVTDIVLCEASTPHLDDVVRVQDDARRPDGRIAAEHK